MGAEGLRPNAKGALKVMLWAKTKTAVIITSAIVLACCGTTIAVRAALGSQAAASAEIEPGTDPSQILAKQLRL
jgi:hypothetical protein